MKFWVGDETGLLKGIQVEGKKQVCKWGEQHRSKEIQRMCWGPGADWQQREDLIFLGLKNRAVQAINCGSGAVIREFGGYDADFVGLDIAGESLATCTASGNVMFRRWDDPEAEPTYTKSHASDIYRMRTCGEDNRLYALGGKGQGRDLKVFDLNADEPVFKAKNVSNDEVDLEVPIWIHDLAFIPGSGGTKLVTVTAHRHVRLYDTKVKKKPVFSAEFGERPIMSVAVTTDGTAAVVGNAIGEMRKVDLRTGRVLCGYKGPAGSVRSIAVHASLPLVATCGLDRHAYVHSLDGALESKVYLKQRLNAILFSGEGRIAVKADDDGEGGDAQVKGDDQEEDVSADEEELWESMEIVQDKSTKRGSDKPDVKEKKRAKKHA